MTTIKLVNRTNTINSETIILTNGEFLLLQNEAPRLIFEQINQNEFKINVPNIGIAKDIIWSIISSSIRSTS